MNIVKNTFTGPSFEDLLGDLGRTMNKMRELQQRRSDAAAVKRDTAATITKQAEADEAEARRAQALADRIEKFIG